MRKIGLIFINLIYWLLEISGILPIYSLILFKNGSMGDFAVRKEDGKVLIWPHTNKAKRWLKKTFSHSPKIGLKKVQLHWTLSEEEYEREVTVACWRIRVDIISDLLDGHNVPVEFLRFRPGLE